MKQLKTKILLLAITLISFNGFGQENALKFDGIDNYVEIPGPILSGDQDFTIEFWAAFNPVQSAGPYPRFFGFTNFKLDFAILYNNTPADGTIYLYDGAWTSSGVEITNGNWYHYAIIKNADVVRVYLNNTEILVRTGRSFNFSSSDNLYLGSRYVTSFGGGEYWDGTMDQFRIWGRALSEDELMDVSNCKILTDSDGLIANYNFDQGIASGNNPTVNTLQDATSNGLDGSLNGFDLSGSDSNWVPSASGITGECSAAPIPTLSQWGIIALSMIMVIFGVLALKYSTRFRLQGKP